MILSLVPTLLMIGVVGPPKIAVTEPVDWCSGGDEKGYSTFGYCAADGGQIVTIWRHTDTPGKRPEKELLTVTITDGRFKQPVWVDMLSGEVHKIPDSAWQSQGSRVTFQNVPVYDHVVLIAERIAIPLEPAKPE